MDRMRAVGDYRSGEQYNLENTAMQKRHRAEMERLLNQGGTESQRMALEDRQNEEKSRLDNAKSISDAIRGSLGDVGSVRGLVGGNVGSTSSLQEAWKRQEQSSFGHIKDPVADAVTNMDRKSQLFHANLMGYLVNKLPGLLSGAQGAQVAMVQNYISEYDGGLA